MTLLRFTWIGAVVLLTWGFEAHAAKPVSITQCDDPGMSFFNITKAGMYQLENDIESIGLFCIHINGIDKVQLRLNGFSISKADIDQGAGITIQNSNRIQILGPGTIKDNDFGIRLLGFTSDIKIRETFIFNHVNVGIAICGECSDILIERNIIATNIHSGINVTVFVRHIRIINNEILENGSGVYIGGGVDTVIRGNNISSNNGNIIIESNAKDVEVTNNIALFASGSDPDIYVGPGVTGIVENNICLKPVLSGSLFVPCSPDTLPSFDINHF